jgi:hypothetical protein
MLASIESPTNAWSGPANHVFLNILSYKSAAQVGVQLEEEKLRIQLPCSKRSALADRS